MTQKRTTHADATPIRVAFVTLDAHLGSAAERALADVRAEIPGLRLSLHAAAEWAENPSALERCKTEIAKADIIIVTMLFVENQIEAILPALQARRDACDAMVCCMSAGDVIKLTKLGKFDMSLPQKGPMALLKRLRGGSKGKAAKPGSSSGAKQMAMLRRLPKILRFIPGTAQDVRAYFLSMQYFLSGSDTNIASMIKLLITRYADGERIHYRGSVEPSDPIEYPEVGLYHPRLREPLTERLDKLPSLTVSPTKGTVGLILIRSYLLSGDTGHYDGVIKTLESRGLKVVPAYASGLDARPAIEKFFMKDGRATVDAVVSLTGFSLVGGPAYNDAKSAEEILGRLDVPYLAAHALEFQTLPQWQASDRGLSPIESTIMVAIPEIDGATSPTVFGGRLGAGETVCNGCERNCRFETSDGSRDMRVCAERAEQLTARVERLIDLRRSERQNRNLAVVLFNFPPNAGGTGTAAFLGVYDSLLNTLRRLKDEGYTVDLPETVDELRTAILEGNSDRFGTDANVFDMIPVDDHVRRERYLPEIEAQWGPAPGR
ncbi:MAG: cobaltochelatase subunit CobN, partial [Pseudomonadota bacterium]